MSLRPPSDKMVDILEAFKGEEIRVYRMQEATPLPPGLCLWHEHSDQYSLQVAEEMSLPEFNERLTTHEWN